MGHQVSPEYTETQLPKGFEGTPKRGNHRSTHHATTTQQPRIAAVLTASPYLAELATAQFVTGPSERAMPILPRTTVSQTHDGLPQAITMVVVTLLVPLDVGRSTNNSPHPIVAGTATSHFFVSWQSGGVSIWSKTTELTRTTISGNLDRPETSPPPQEDSTTTLTATYTDY
ncbi:hypothetical protein B0T14DRAFT_569936 [Immersiella caudata]|uniref:Uncharacterized protein n=1 Tax=Immersiella caudata TaxID=314043 RepID=A0AA39WEI6_9PEZI|nr:hypothetical protein B0T14DRAFT_569936 [Immersiella caudata]